MTTESSLLTGAGDGENREPIVNYMPQAQQRLVLELIQRTEGRYYVDKVKELNETIRTMPALYGTEQQALKDKTIYLHYFYGGSDWFIAEKGTTEDPDTMFGFAILNGDTGNAEWGYVSMEEINSVPGIEMDFHWTPRAAKDVPEIQT